MIKTTDLTTPDVTTERRWPALAGVAFVVAVVAAVGALGDSPRPDADAATVVTYWTAGSSTGLAAAYLFAAAAPLILVFGATVARDATTRLGARSSIWPQVLVGGAIVAAAGFLVASAATFAIAEAAGAHADASLVALSALGGDAQVAFNGGLGILLLGAAGTFLPMAGVRRTLGWAALVVGVATFLPLGSAAGIACALLTFTWVLVTAVVTWRRP